MSKPVMQDSALIGDAEQLEALFLGNHANPHGLLGAHPGHMGGQDGAIGFPGAPGSTANNCAVAASAACIRHSVRRVRVPMRYLSQIGR